VDHIYKGQKLEDRCEKKGTYLPISQIMEDTFPSAEERFLKIEGPGHFLEVEFWFQNVSSKYTRELFASLLGVKRI
jgi:hypothetical protein